MKILLYSLLFLSGIICHADNLIPNATFRDKLNGFRLYGKVETVPDSERVSRGDLEILEGGISIGLRPARWTPGLYRLRVRFRNTGGDRSMALVGTVRNARGFVSNFKAKPDTGDGADVYYTALVPLAPDATVLDLWCKGKNTGTVGIDHYTLELQPGQRIDEVPGKPQIILGDALTEEFKVTLQFRNYERNSRGAILERSVGGAPFEVVGDTLPYAHTAIDPAALPGTRCRYRLKNRSDGDESPYSNEFTVEIPAFVHSPGGKSYYVDSENGSDAASGESENSAWKSLEKVSLCVFAPGDRICFRRNSRWNTPLELRGGGSDEKPVVLSAYGEGNTPRIEVESLFAVRLRNRSHWDISGLFLANRQPVPESVSEIKRHNRTLDRNDRFFQPYARKRPRHGFLLKLDNCGVMENIRLHNLQIEDIEGAQDSKENGGIVVDIDGYRVPSRIDRLEIFSNTLRRICRSGIVFRVWPHARRSDWFPSTNVKITDNILYDIGGDGIVPWACDGALVARNQVYRAACTAYEANVAIWPWSCDNTLITGNTAAFTAKYPGNGDGQGFDIDTNNFNTVVENNLSYHNEGGFILICGEETTLNRKAVVRNNISISDGMSVFTLWNNLEDIRIYNNTVYSPNNSKAVFLIANWGKGDTDPIQMKKVEFFNNLVYADTPLAFRGLQKSWNIHHNLYFGSGAKSLAVTGGKNTVRDPEFTDKVNTALDIPPQLEKLRPRNASGGVSVILAKDYTGKERKKTGAAGALEPK